MPTKLLDILCCPKCKGGLQFDQQKNILTCTSCRTIYPVKNGIPIMLADDTERERQGNVG